MARGIGQLVVSLGLDAAEFVTGMSRAEVLAKKQAEQLERQLGQGARAVGVAIGTIVAASGAAAVAIDQMLKSVADFKDLEETTGAAAEGIASLSLAAAAAGVDIESVAGSMQKLTKNLTGVDDESKAAGAALTALGLSVAEFKRLDPVAQYEAVAQALGRYADGAEKTAVAQALFGKSGAEQLKVFKALEEQGGRNVVLTQAQIDAADKYADAQALALAQLKQYAQVAATEFLPAMNDLLLVVTEVAKSFTVADTAAGALAAQKELREFADGLASALAQVADFAIGVAKGFEVVGKTIGASFAIAKAAREGQLVQAQAIATELEADVTRITTYLSLSERLDKQRAARMAAERAAAANPASYSNEGRGKGLPTIDFDGGKKNPKGGSAAKQRQKDDEEAARASLAVEEMAAKDAAEAWAVWEKYRLAESQATTDATAEMYRQWFAEIDAEQDRAIEDGKALVEAKLEQISEFQKQAMRNIQDFVGTELENLMAGNFDNIGQRFAELVRRMASQAAAAQISEHLFGKDGTSGAAGGLWGTIGKLFSGGSGSGSGGSSYAYTDSSGGFSMVPQMATGTNFVPRDMLAMVHQGEAIVPREYNPAAGGVAGGAAGGAVSVQVVNNGQPVSAAATTEKKPDGTQLVKLVLNALSDDVRKGGKSAKAFQDVYGVKRQTARR